MALMVAASSAWVPSNHRRASRATTKKVGEPFPLPDFCPVINQWAATGFIVASLALTPLPSQAATDPPTGVRMQVETNKLIKSIQESKGELNAAISNIVKDKASADIQLDPPANKAEEIRDALNAWKESAKEEVKTPLPEPKAQLKDDPEVPTPDKAEDVPVTVKPGPTPSEFAPAEVAVNDGEPKQSEAKKAEPPATEVKSQESKPVETKKEETTPKESKKQELESKPVETKKEESTPIESKKQEAKPTEEKKVETPALVNQKQQEEPAIEPPKSVVPVAEIPVVKKEADTGVKAKKEPLVPVEVKKEAPAQSSEERKPETPPVEAKIEPPKPVEANRDDPKSIDLMKEYSKKEDTEEKTKQESPSSFGESILDKVKASIETPTMDVSKTEGRKSEALKPVEAQRDEPKPIDVKKEDQKRENTEENTRQERPSFGESVLDKLKASIETPTMDESKTEAIKPEAPKSVEVKKVESTPIESKMEESKASESNKEEPKPLVESDKDESNAAKLPTLKDLIMEKINENTPEEVKPEASKSFITVPPPPREDDSILKKKEALESEASKSVTTVPQPPEEDDSILKKKVYNWLFNYKSPSEPRKIAILDPKFWERPLIRTTFVSPDGTGDINLAFTNGEVAAGTAIAIGVSYLVSYSLYDSERAEEERRAEAKRAAAAIKKKKPGYTVVNPEPEAKQSGTTSSYSVPSFVDRLKSLENGPPTATKSELDEISLQSIAKKDEKRGGGDSYLDALSGASSSNSARSLKQTKSPGGGSYLDSL
jgi:hypothetical protein